MPPQPTQPPVVPSFTDGKSCCSKHASFGYKILMVLVAVVLVYLTFYLGTLMRNNVKQYSYIGQADQQERTITVNGFGKVSGKNDIAMTTMGYSTIDKDVGKAQTDNTNVMNLFLADLKGLGVAEQDLESDYSIYPEYDYTQIKGQQLKGYRVTNNVTIKVRDLTKISSILSLAGKFNLNEVSGLSFTIDDTDSLKAQARAKSLANAKMKAAQLALSLGMQLGEVIAYSEYDTNQQPYPMYEKSMGTGGMMDAAPVIASGSRDVGMNVSITYKMYRADRFDRW